MRICVVGSSRFPIREPFAGGLEAHTHALVLELRRRGHTVAVYAAPGSDPRLDAELLDVPPLIVSDRARRDVGAPPEWWLREHHAYLGLMLSLQRRGREFDLIHNNSLHHLPVAMAPSLPFPMVTTLHTPPLPWLESAISLAAGAGTFVAVSESMRRAWSHVLSPLVVHNGVDPGLWSLGPGGPRAVWSGRLVPEKAPHEAIHAALRAGLGIDLTGPVGDSAYVERAVAPLLGDDVRYLGHLTQHDVRRAVAHAAVAVVSPAWEEPFGLVAAEAMSTGTPVAAYRRGALPEIVCGRTGRLAAPGDIDDLARAIEGCLGLDRRRVRATATSRFALARMVDGYERIYRGLTGRLAA